MVVRNFRVTRKSVFVLTLAALLLGTGVARADAGIGALSAYLAVPTGTLPTTATATRYEELSNTYTLDAATALNPELTEGWWSGRCFGYSDQNVAKPALLIVSRHTEAERDDGPLFPPAAEWKVIHMTHYGNVPASFFDDLTERETSDIQNALNRDAAGISVAAGFSDGSFGSTNVAGNLEYRVKQNGEYIYERSTLIASQSGVAAGQAFEMCYYFRKVR